jgi:hypothetical protein
MRNNATAEKNSIPGVSPSAPWRVAAVESLSDYRLKVRFIDGTEGTVAMAALIFGEQAGVFAALRDPAVFAQVSVEMGVTTWPGEIDLAPDAMYEEIRKHGEWRL